MSLTQRKSVQDFLSAIRQQSNLVHNFGATLNADGSVQVTSTPVSGGTATVLFPKVWWNISGQRSAATDANQSSCDTVTIENADGSNASVGDAQTFLNTLV